jgi:hypothetical protein
MNLLQSRIENDFTYHPPTEEMIPKFAEIRNAARLLAHLINQSTPDGREKSLALSSLEETVMWANAGIARA